MGEGRMDRLIQHPRLFTLLLQRQDIRIPNPARKKAVKTSIAQH